MNRRALLLLALLNGVALAAPPVSQTTAVEIVSAEFGLFDASNPDELVFTPTTVVPHTLGQRYGWVIEVRTGKRSLAVREEYLLANPSPPTADSPLNIVLPRRNQVSQRQLVPVAGRIYGEWAIGPGEPAGHRRLQVIIESTVSADFAYDVQ